MTELDPHIHELFRCCRKQVGNDIWNSVLEKLPSQIDLADLVDFLVTNPNNYSLPDYLPDLARLEGQMYLTAQQLAETSFSVEHLCVNPTLSLIRVNWKNLPEIIRGTADTVEPTPGEAYVLIWHHPEKENQFIRQAEPDELLALKIVVEELDKRVITRQEDTTLAALDNAIDKAVKRGILLTPGSTLNRDPSLFPADTEVPEKYRTAHVFTLQWHITQACDLNCKHCYDRSSRENLKLQDGIAILDQMYDFCQERNVYGQISFSGGNPLLHPNFFELYQAAADRGFMIAVLGNPTDPETLSRLNSIQKPEFYQVSLEGLLEHNDYIRGTGFFDRVMQFLNDLRAAEIYSMVMLTLTRNNMNQVLPLGEILRDKADLFTFNRLSMVGAGAQLLTPDKEEYKAFLRSYLEAEKENPVLALKDSLINIIRMQEGVDLFGGCAGFGCGAAFNFVSLLPDGEVHACRKFPSPIGSIFDRKLSEIYDSDRAERYRHGPSACRDCSIRPVCGGCLAVIDSNGLDLTTDRDPCCFLERS